MQLFSPSMQKTLINGLFQFFKMRYNSYTLKFTILKHETQWILILSQSCAAIITIKFQNIFITPKNPHTPYQSLLSLPSPKPLIYLVSILYKIVYSRDFT